MPLVKGKDLAARIGNTRKLLIAAALIMSVFLSATSLVTTLLIEPAKFKDGGEANGRALAYLGHKFLGNGFGSLYDVSTILILAFAGASALAGLLSLIPRYLPRFGMAPEWARATRPLVLVFMAISFTVTILFRANVDAQGGAYATGVLVLITSAALAVTIAAWKRQARWPFLLISVVFIYTTVLNVYERPEGLKIGCFFIAVMVATSVVSRAMRSTELRICGIQLDATAETLLGEDEDGVIHLVARKPGDDSAEALDQADRDIRSAHNLPANEHIYFFEVERTDASTFEETIQVRGERLGEHAILRAQSPVVANSIAALLIHLEQSTGKVPHGYFRWTEHNPIANLFQFLFFGKGDVAPIAHEVLRRAIPDPRRRPCIHVM
jgi:hypothetical protein